MRTKIKKLLYESSKNARITTKELGKKISATQQSASYLLKQFKKRNYIEKSITRVDTAKLGLINIIVGFNFLIIDSSEKKEIIQELKTTNEIISIEENQEGIDLIIEYSTQNLSAFSKIHAEIISKFFKKIKTVFVLPIIVNHEYPRKYLTKKFEDIDIVLCGDRDIQKLSKDEMKVLYELVKHPDEKIINIADLAKVSVKSTIKIKKSLERRFIIKGYEAVLNHSKLGINRELIFLRFSGEGMNEIERFRTYARGHKNIIRFIKLIGEYQVAIIAEDIKEVNITKSIRSKFLIESYIISKSEKIHKKGYIPRILD